MNFVKHSKPGSLHSGDATECIEAGLELVRRLLGWTLAASNLLAATDDESDQEESRRSDVETYIGAAEQHGMDDDPDHEVGDLQDYLREVWSLLTPEQRATFAELPDVRERLANTEARDDNDTHEE